MNSQECSYCAFYGTPDVLATRAHVETHPIIVEVKA